jgi:hypothetical protein
LRFSPCSRHIPQKTLVDEIILEQSTVFPTGTQRESPGAKALIRRGCTAR